MISTNGRLVEQTKIVQGLHPVAPSTTVPRYVCLKNYEKMTIIIEGVNGTTVTGSAITLKQATAVANTGEKALAFDKVWATTDTPNSDALTETAVSSNTFTTVSTNSVKYQYVIEVDPATLDVANGYDCVRLGTGDVTNTTISAVYVLWPARYAKATPPSAIID